MLSFFPMLPFAFTPAHSKTDTSLNQTAACPAALHPHGFQNLFPSAKVTISAAALNSTVAARTA